MATTSISKTQLSVNTSAVLPTYVAIDATDGASITFDKEDSKILLLITNAATSTKTVTIKKGNGLQGVADLAISLGASEKRCIVIESMKYVNMTGTYKGKILITGTDANVTLAAVVLP